MSARPQTDAEALREAAGIVRMFEAMAALERVGSVPLGSPADERVVAKWGSLAAHLEHLAEEAS